VNVPENEKQKSLGTDCPHENCSDEGTILWRRLSQGVAEGLSYWLDRNKVCPARVLFLSGRPVPSPTMAVAGRAPGHR
jgi:hypothetical protein